MIDLTLDSPGPLQGIPDFLRRSEAELAQWRTSWNERIARESPFERAHTIAATRQIAQDALRVSVRLTNAEQATPKVILQDVHRIEAQEMAARSYLEVGDAIPATEYLTTAPLRKVTAPSGPVQNPRGPTGPRQDGMTDAERATIDQYFAIAYPNWRITKQGGTPSFFLRQERTNKCVWVEPVFNGHQLSTKQADVIREYAACGFKIEIVPVRRMPRRLIA